MSVSEWHCSVIPSTNFLSRVNSLQLLVFLCTSILVVLLAILAIFDLQGTPMLPTNFSVNWPFGSEKEAKNWFSRWLLWHDFSYFLSTSHPDASYQVSSQLAFGSGEEKKNRFSRWPQWWPSWISDQNDFSYFSSISSPDASNQLWRIGLSVLVKKRKIDFQDGCHGGFMIGKILAIFDLQVTRSFLQTL